MRNFEAANQQPKETGRHGVSEGMTGNPLVQRFKGHVDVSPEATALVDDEGNFLTRSELWGRATELATDLAQRGVKERDVVFIVLPNMLTWQVSLLACLQMGAVPATVPVTTDKQTLAHMMKISAARATIASRDERGRALAAEVRAIFEELGAAGSVATIEPDGAMQWDDVEGQELGPVTPDGTDQLMFTSATTGLPKGVIHTASTLAAVNQGVSNRFGITSEDTIFMPSPLGHSVGAWHGGRLALYTGASLVLQRKWNPALAVELIDEYQCTFTAAATPFLKDLIDLEVPESQTKCASLTTFICGGAAVPRSLIEKAPVELPNTLVTVLWGMTEGGITTGTKDSTDEQLATTAGLPLADLELAIEEVANPDTYLETGIGELVMRGPGVFVGYLGRDDLYRSSLTKEGYFRTGDLAELGSDGYLRLRGRQKEMIIRGGVNISPVAIEEAVSAHPAVQSVAVVGKEDERLGERICAVITVKASDAAPTLEELNEWMLQRGLPRRKCPESLEIVRAMPVTAAGKIQKAVLKKNLKDYV